MHLLRYMSLSLRKTLIRNPRQEKYQFLLIENRKAFFFMKKLMTRSKSSITSSLEVEIEIENPLAFKYLYLSLKPKRKLSKNIKLRLAGDNIINDNNIKSFLVSIRRLHFLRSLDLEFSSFESCLSTKSLQKLIFSLRNYPDLQNFNILCNGGNNAITDKGFIFLTDLIKKKKSLESIGIFLRGADNSITDQGLKIFQERLAIQPIALKHLKIDLKSFGARNNSISSNGANFLAEALKNLPDLEHLLIDFSGGINKIMDSGACNIGNSLNHLKNLKSFVFNCEMGYNQITCQGLRKIAEGLLTIQNLRLISMNFSNFMTSYGGDNYIGDFGLLKLIIAVTKMKNLKILRLRARRNGITDTGIREILTETGNVDCKLENVECDIRDNDNLTTEFASKLEDLFKNCSKECTIYS